MEGFLLPEIGLRIVADRSFFCPLSKSLLITPVDLIFGDNLLTVDRASLETWFKTVGKDVCPLSGASIREWIIVKSNKCLKDRIKEWARRQLLDLDAIEVAALKLRSKAALGLQNKLEGQTALRRQQRDDIRRDQNLKLSQSCDVDWLLIDPISGKSTTLDPSVFQDAREKLHADARSGSLPAQHEGS
ncbi:hypothetical protein WJX75_001827 [Coccomyxa subellipsoidea]|uniref:U-box domain-containing protein n=1 Tax=Coccomyxa subellipsoidea TaxID=248742 RepID=A0ABR2Z2H3_9CHLO